MKIVKRFPAVGEPTKTRLYFADTEQDLATSVPSSSTRMPDSSLIPALSIFYGCCHSKLVFLYARCTLLLRKQTLCCRLKSVKSDAVLWRLRHKHVQKKILPHVLATGCCLVVSFAALNVAGSQKSRFKAKTSQNSCQRGTMRQYSS
jgi:hypothetical protein